MKLKITSPTQTISDEHVPNIKLCRFFEEQDHLDVFVDGKYRFGNLKKYRSSEFKLRSDPTELEANNSTPNGAMFGQFSSGNYYAMCFTEVNKSTQHNTLSEKFGKPGTPAVCLPIQSNLEFTKSILSAWSHSVDKLSIGYFQWFKVIYNKNDVVNSNLLTQWDGDIHIYQKPREHIIHRAKRIKQTPIKQLDSSPLQIIDAGGPIGAVTEFSSLDISEMHHLRDLESKNDWEMLEPKTNSFEIEQEWRLVFVSDNRQHNETKEILVGIREDYYWL